MATNRDLPTFPELWLRFRELQVIEDQYNMNRGDNIGWLPPECTARFRPTPAPWHIWRPGVPGRANTMTAAQHDRPNHVKMYQTTSLFYSTELHSFLEVPYDVTIEHVADRRRSYDEDGWSRISFTNRFRTATQPNLWMIGHGHRSNQINKDFWSTDSWDELLLPGSFANGPWQRNRDPTCELGGSLPIIFGLIAFATQPNDLIGMIRESFRPSGRPYYVPTWCTNRLTDQGSESWSDVRLQRSLTDMVEIPKRGIIVDVAFDARTVRRSEIRAWEDGRHGPILKSSHNYNRTRA